MKKRLNGKAVLACGNSVTQYKASLIKIVLFLLNVITEKHDQNIHTVITVQVYLVMKG